MQRLFVVASALVARAAVARIVVAGASVAGGWLAGSASADSLVVDDFSDRPIEFVLREGTRYESVIQSGDWQDPFSTRRWSDVWGFPSNLNPTAPPAEVSIATASEGDDDGVFRVATPGDPFTYFELSYGSEQFPLRFDALTAGYDRLRLRFRGESTGAPLVQLASQVDGVRYVRRVGPITGLGALPEDAIVDVVFADLIEPEIADAFLTDLESISLLSARFRGDFELDSIELARTPIEGDLDRDGVLDSGDRRFWASQYVAPGLAGPLPPATGRPTADLNRDGWIDAADYTLWRDVFDSTPFDGAGSEGTQVAPEPMGLASALVAVAIGLVRRRS